MMYEDQVPRLEKFKADHPEIEIHNPVDSHSMFWKACGDGKILAVELDLRRLLDTLERLT